MWASVMFRTPPWTSMPMSEPICGCWDVWSYAFVTCRSDAAQLSPGLQVSFESNWPAWWWEQSADFTISRWSRIFCISDWGKSMQHSEWDLNFAIWEPTMSPALSRQQCRLCNVALHCLVIVVLGMYQAATRLSNVSMYIIYNAYNFQPINFRACKLDLGSGMPHLLQSRAHGRWVSWFLKNTSYATHAYRIYHRLTDYSQQNPLNTHISKQRGSSKAQTLTFSTIPSIRTCITIFSACAYGILKGSHSRAAPQARRGFTKKIAQNGVFHTQNACFCDRILICLKPSMRSVTYACTYVCMTLYVCVHGYVR
jgi:hypothetical protein